MTIWRAVISVRDDSLIGDQLYTLNPWVSEDGADTVALEDAIELAEVFVGTLLADSAVVYKVAIQDPVTHFTGLSYLHDYPGTRSVTGDALPGFNTCKVQFTGVLGQRPSTYHLRVGITEGDVSGQVIGAPLLTALDAFIAGWIAQGHGCDPHGRTWVSGSRSDLVTNRQMSWHRRSRPGFHRGYVAN